MCHGSVHRESMPIIVQQDVTIYSLLYFCKLLYIFRVVTPPIIRSTYNFNCSIWHCSNFGKCSVWSQLKMRGMDPSLLPFAIVRSRKAVRASSLFFANWHSPATLTEVFPVVRQMPGHTSQRLGTIRTLPSYCIVSFYILFVSIVLFYILFVCECVL